MMTNPYQPTHDLYIIPMKSLEKELRNWFLTVQKLNIPLEFSCESSESSSGHMGDLYFNINEEEISGEDLKALQDAYENHWGMLSLKAMLQDFFETDELSYDVHPFKEEVYIRIPK